MPLARWAPSLTLPALLEPLPAVRREHRGDDAPQDQHDQRREPQLEERVEDDDPERGQRHQGQQADDAGAGEHARALARLLGRPRLGRGVG